MHKLKYLFVLLVLVSLMISCKQKEEGFTVTELTLEGRSNVVISGEIENVRGVMSFSINDLPYSGIARRDANGKYHFRIPMYYDSAFLPVPDSISIKLLVRCRNDATPKMSVNVKSDFLKQPNGPKKEVEFDRCKRGLTNKMFYVRIKDKEMESIQLDSLTAPAI